MIITVTSFKGGVGKTTTAVHLAAFFQGQAPTVLIDADPNRSALGWSRRGNLPFPVVDEWHTDHLQGDYRHVIIDTQARPTPTDLATLVRHCHLLVLPTTPDVLALEALVLTVDHLGRLPRPQQQIPYQILLAAVPPKPSRAGDEVRSLLTEAQLPTFKGSIRRYAAFQKAAQAGVPVYGVKDGKAEAAWQDYEAVGQEILAAWSGQT
jgi:chromosome partitioning protein